MSIGHESKLLHHALVVVVIVGGVMAMTVAHNYRLVAALTNRRIADSFEGGVHGTKGFSVSVFSGPLRIPSVCSAQPHWPATRLPFSSSVHPLLFARCLATLFISCHLIYGIRCYELVLLCPTCGQMSKVISSPTVSSTLSTSSVSHKPADTKAKGALSSVKPPGQVARRNARERNRVRQVNMGFVTLRNHIPHSGKAKKLSKVETLRSAACYIRYLKELLSSTETLCPQFEQSSHQILHGLQTFPTCSFSAPNSAVSTPAYNNCNTATSNNNSNGYQASSTPLAADATTNCRYDEYSFQADPAFAPLQPPLAQRFCTPYRLSDDSDKSSSFSGGLLMSKPQPPGSFSGSSSGGSFVSDPGYDFGTAPTVMPVQGPATLPEQCQYSTPFHHLMSSF